MPVSYIFNKLIKDEMVKLPKVVDLVIFTDTRESEILEETLEILKIYQESSNGMLKIKLISNPDLIKKYQITHFPAISFINNDENEIIRYLATPSGPEIQPFIQALFSFAGNSNYYDSSIKKNIKNIKQTTIKVLITGSCAYCPQQVNFANQFALASEGKIKTIIIDITKYPEIAEKYDAFNFPFTIINENKNLVGLTGPSELLDEIIGGNLNV